MTDRPMWRCRKCGRELFQVRIDTISRRNHVHFFRITDAGEIDAEVRGCLAEACAVGKQEHLRRSERE